MQGHVLGRAPFPRTVSNCLLTHPLLCGGDGMGRWNAAPKAQSQQTRVRHCFPSLPSWFLLAAASRFQSEGLVVSGKDLCRLHFDDLVGEPPFRHFILPHHNHGYSCEVFLCSMGRGAERNC